MICAIFLAAICGLMVGCRPINDIKEELENSSSAVGGKIGLEILRCFNERDSESLKEMCITPEFEFDGYYNIMNGAELYKVTKDGDEVLLAIYKKLPNESSGKFIRLEDLE